MTDNSLTPHIVVDATLKNVKVPSAHVRDGKITLNIAYHAVRNLDMSNDWVSFNARFGGVAQSIAVPVYAVLAVYAKETGQGMEFGPEPGDVPPPEDQDKPAVPPRGKPTLRRVK
jgi:stringent starvation protein B